MTIEQRQKANMERVLANAMRGWAAALVSNPTNVTTVVRELRETATVLSRE
jgi:hypothetical protein